MKRETKAAQRAIFAAKARAETVDMLCMVHVDENTHEIRYLGRLDGSDGGRSR